MAKYFNESELSYKTLLAGAQQPVVTDVVKITPGEYVLGTLLANDGSGIFAPVDSNAGTINAVLLQDTTSDDKKALVAYTGEFLISGVICSGKKAPSEALIEAAKNVNIYFRKQSNKEVK